MKKPERKDCPFMKETVCDIAIIGGGASGLMLAASLDLEGARGVILEGSSQYDGHAVNLW